MCYVSQDAPGATFGQVERISYRDYECLLGLLVGSLEVCAHFYGVFGYSRCYFFVFLVNCAGPYVLYLRSVGFDAFVFSRVIGWL